MNLLMCFHTDAKFSASLSELLTVQLSAGYHQYPSPWMYANYKSNYENWHLNTVINDGIDALGKNYLVL